MDEYQHFERLSADVDFEEGQWIGGEFVYKKRKKGAQQTEDDRLYGVFQGSSDEDDFGKRRRRRDSDGRSLHKHVAFVSKGVVTGTTDPNDEDIVINSGQDKGICGAPLPFCNLICIQFLASRGLLVARPL
jgi:tuftelin-interacting protein 11